MLLAELLDGSRGPMKGTSGRHSHSCREGSRASTGLALKTQAPSGEGMRGPGPGAVGGLPPSQPSHDPKVKLGIKVASFHSRVHCSISRPPTPSSPPRPTQSTSDFPQVTIQTQANPSKDWSYWFRKMT